MQVISYDLKFCLRVAAEVQRSVNSTQEDHQVSVFVLGCGVNKVDSSSLHFSCKCLQPSASLWWRGTSPVETLWHCTHHHCHSPPLMTHTMTEPTWGPVAGFLWSIQCISRDHSIWVPNGRWIDRDGWISTLCEGDRVCWHLPQGAPVYPHLSPHLSSHLPSLGLCRCFTIHFSSSRQAFTVALRAEGPTALWSLCFTLERKIRDLLHTNDQTQTT